MTNPISKAIVKAAVAMGYGKKSDYKGSSVADVLEKFAAIAKDKGSSGGGTVYAVFNESSGTWSCDKTVAELKAAWDAGNTIIAVIAGSTAWTAPMYMYDFGGMQLFSCGLLNANPLVRYDDKIRVDKVSIEYSTQDGSDVVHLEHKIWDVSATVHEGS